MFEIERRGYNRKDVESFISNLNKSSTELVKGLRAEIDDLKRENFELKNDIKLYKDKEVQINKALISANEKADQITKDSESVFNLQIQNLQALYEKYFDTMQTIKAKYNLFDEEELSADNFKRDIGNLLDRSISEDIKNEKYFSNREVKSGSFIKDDDKYDKYYHKQLLTKLSDGLANSKEVTVHKEEYTPRFEPKIDYAFLEKVKNREREEEAAKAKIKQNLQDSAVELDSNYESKPSLIKPILNMSQQKNSGGVHYTSLLEKYLNEDSANSDFVTPTYAKKIVEKTSKPNLFSIPDNYKGPNDTGFDLREAVNPKQSLEDIMKDFDFFGNDSEE